jgi:hypothetical protein
MGYNIEVNSNNSVIRNKLLYKFAIDSMNEKKFVNSKFENIITEFRQFSDFNSIKFDKLFEYYSDKDNFKGTYLGFISSKIPRKASMFFDLTFAKQEPGILR